MADKTIVLVHGAFAESASWNGVIGILQSQGYSVVAVANPLRGVYYDSDYLASLLETIEGPVVVVGHSYGGTVITNAATGKQNVKALVYVAGFAPEKGEAAGELSTRFPGSTLNATLAPPIRLPQGNTDIYIQQDKYWQQFIADVSEQDGKILAANQRPATDNCFTETSREPAWKTIPSWFIYGELDKNITAYTHSFMAERANSRETVEIKGASHAFMVAHAEEVARIIVTAAQAV